jgi:hypothetical protein
MSMNSLRAGKFLLTAGLLLVLAKGLYQCSGLQDYLFPGGDAVLKLRRANITSDKIGADLIALRARVDYLKWLMAHGVPDQKFSIHRMLSFPFSECIRPLYPRYCWQINFYLAQKDRVNMERKLRYLEALFTNLEKKFQARSSQDNPAILLEKAAVLSSMNQIQQLQGRCRVYSSELMEITKQLTWIKNNDYKN